MASKYVKLEKVMKLWSTEAYNIKYYLKQQIRKLIQWTNNTLYLNREHLPL